MRPSASAEPSMRDVMQAWESSDNSGLSYGLALYSHINDQDDARSAGVRRLNRAPSILCFSFQAAILSGGHLSPRSKWFDGCFGAMRTSFARLVLPNSPTASTYLHRIAPLLWPSSKDHGLCTNFSSAAGDTTGLPTAFPLFAGPRTTIAPTPSDVSFCKRLPTALHYNTSLYQATIARRDHDEWCWNYFQTPTSDQFPLIEPQMSARKAPSDGVKTTLNLRKHTHLQLPHKSYIWGVIAAVSESLCSRLCAMVPVKLLFRYIW